MNSLQMGTGELIEVLERHGYRITRSEDYIKVVLLHGQLIRFDAAYSFKAWAFDLI